MENEMPTTQLVQLYGQEYSAALSQATTKLIRAREWLDTSKFPLHRAKAREQITSASKVIADIVAALRREATRIDSEWWIYDAEEDVRSYRQFLIHLVDRSLYNNTEKDRLTPAERKETECQNPPSK